MTVSSLTVGSHKAGHGVSYIFELLDSLALLSLPMPCLPSCLSGCVWRRSYSNLSYDVVSLTWNNTTAGWPRTLDGLII